MQKIRRWFVAVDAIWPPDTAFQMTVSENHPIHVDIAKLVQHCGSATFTVYCVVPARLVDRY